MSEIIRPSSTIICPPGKTSGTPLVIDLTLVHEVEQRIKEVAFITPSKAPELMARFNEAFLVLSEELPKIEYQRLLAQREADRRKSVVLLDEASKIMTEKGLANSADVRKAILDLDQTYQDMLDKAQQIACIYETLEGKKKAIEMAYTATKKILGENVYAVNNRLNALVEESAEAGQTINSSGKVVAGFGKARY